MGSNSRYDRARPVSDHEADEARAFHTLAELVFDKPSLIADRRLLGQVAQLLHSVGNELDNGRAVALPVRRSVRGLAGALREALQPNATATVRSSAAPRQEPASPVEAPVFRAAP
jgi:hypothetical protein